MRSLTSGAPRHPPPPPAPPKPLTSFPAPPESGVGARSQLRPGERSDGASSSSLSSDKHDDAAPRDVSFLQQPQTSTAPQLTDASASSATPTCGIEISVQLDTKPIPGRYTLEALTHEIFDSSNYRKRQRREEVEDAVVLRLTEAVSGRIEHYCAHKLRALTTRGLNK